MKHSSLLILALLCACAGSGFGSGEVGSTTQGTNTIVNNDETAQNIIYPGSNTGSKNYPTGPTLPGLGKPGSNTGSKNYPTGPTLPGLGKPGSNTGSKNYPTGPTLPGLDETDDGCSNAGSSVLNVNLDCGNSENNYQSQKNNDGNKH